MFINAKLSKNMFWEFKNIRRYSTRIVKLFNENDAEHSFMAAVIAMRLAVKYKLTADEELQLIKMVMFHDAGELITGDINTLCKTKTLKEEIAKIEQPLYSALEKYFNFNNTNEKLYHLLKAADTLCVKFFGDINSDKELSEDGFRNFKKHLRRFKNANKR